MLKKIKIVGWTPYLGSYLRGCHTVPLSLHAPGYLRLADRTFQELKSLEPTQPPLTCPPCPKRMLDTLTQFVDDGSALFQPTTQQEYGVHSHKLRPDVPPSGIQEESGEDRRGDWCMLGTIYGEPWPLRFM